MERHPKMTDHDSVDSELDPADPQVERAAPLFRLVAGPDGERDSLPEAPPGAPESRWLEVSKYLLINGEPWLARWSKAPEGYVKVKASIPLIASLTRIRSRSDAALALTMVIETLYVDFHVQLPCGAVDDSEIAFLLPERCDLERVTEAIDQALATQVRATDLQGGMRDRTKSRICPF